MPDKQLKPGVDERGKKPGRKWRVLIGVALIIIGLGLGAYDFFGPVGQPQPATPSQRAAQPKTGGSPAPKAAAPSDQRGTAQTGPASRRSFLQWVEDNRVVLGLFLTALGVLIGAWGAFRPGKPSETHSSDQSINQHTSGQNNQPVAVNQRGQGSSVHVGDLHIHGDPETARLATDYAERYGQTKQLMESFLRRLEKENVPPEKWDETLDKIVEEYRTFQARASAFQADDPETKRLIDEGRELADQAMFEEAYQKLDQASDRELKAAGELDTASQQRKTNAAEVLAIKAHLKNTQREFLSAAQLFEQAAELVNEFDEKTADNYLLQAAGAYRDQGGSRGDNHFLEKSVAICKTLLARTYKERDPMRWGALQNSLGNALNVLGGREPGPERLEQAVRAYQEILDSFARQDAPLDWAATQNNLGEALRVLGEREPGTGRLEQAVQAFREALKEYTRERAPLDWAMTQNNLAGALLRLGERGSDYGRLEQAAQAFREALEEQTRERAPLQWAMTQNNLGNILAILGDRENGTGRLEEAVQAFREALKEYTRDRAPSEWALTQNNLGNILAILGRRDSDPGRLEQAVQSYREALKERTQERAPLQWATTQNNLGNALRALGEREPGTERLEQAVTACRKALEERTRERVPLDWAKTKNNLGNALCNLGIRNSDTALLLEAVEALEAALEVFRDAGLTHYVEMTSANLEEFRQALSELQAQAKEHSPDTR